MTEQIDQDNAPPIEGTVEHPARMQRYFNNLRALTDYINVFNIEGGMWQKIQEQGKTYFVLVYNKQN